MASLTCNPGGGDGLEVSTSEIKDAPVEETDEVLETAGRCALRSLPCWLGNCPSLQWHYLLQLVWHLAHSLAPHHSSIYPSLFMRLHIQARDCSQ
jgi:hypothetical protein